MKLEEFYVGYLPQAPDRIAKVIRKIVVCLAILVAVVLVIIIFNQRRSSTATFEYGILTTIEGNLFMDPVPHLAIQLGKDAFQKDVTQIVLLVSSGKSGASGIVKNLLDKKNIDQGSRVLLTGSLIYGDGKAILQIDEVNNSLSVVGSKTTMQRLSMEELNIISEIGEIVDPKCYFGVMKPGEGKPHRSCAIRCISGGIAPVFHVPSTGKYYLLTDEDGRPVNNAILPLVADNIRLSGKAVQWADWRIMRLSTAAIEELSQSRKAMEYMLTFENGIALCSNH